MLAALDLCIAFWWINATTYLAFIEQSFYFVYKSAFNEPWKRWLLNNSLLHSSSTASNYTVYNYIIVQYNVCPTIPVFYYCTALWHWCKSPFHFHSQPLSFCLLSRQKRTRNCTLTVEYIKPAYQPQHKCENNGSGQPTKQKGERKVLLDKRKYEKKEKINSKWCMLFLKLFS